MCKTSEFTWCIAYVHHLVLFFFDDKKKQFFFFFVTSRVDHHLNFFFFKHHHHLNIYLIFPMKISTNKSLYQKKNLLKSRSMGMIMTCVYMLTYRETRVKEKLQFFQILSQKYYFRYFLYIKKNILERERERL